MIESPLGTATLTCTLTIYPSGRIATQGNLDVGTHPPEFNILEFGTVLNSAVLTLCAMNPSEVDRATLMRWAENAERSRNNQPQIQFFTATYAYRLWRGILHDIKVLFKMAIS